MHRAEKTDLTEAQATQITGRVDHVLEVLPKAKKQARQRIVGGRRVRSDEKVLSVYETAAKVIVRSQTRRAQAEAREAIITNSYQRGRSLSEGLESQRQELRRVMLAHNLRKLARQLKAERAARERAKGQAA